MNLSIRNLTKQYPNGVKALNNVSLEIGSGMFGLVGPNGAGKSSLMRTIATLQEADSGEISFNEVNVLAEHDAIRRTLGYLPQEFGVYPRVNAVMLLDHFAQLKGISNSKERKETVEALLHKTNLWEHKSKNLGTFSGGMKQRFGIAQALLGNPSLIIVDEPTAGLDPGERNRFHNLLSEISESVVVILSTHIIEDVQSLCNNMAIINKGTILAYGKPQDLVKEYEGKIWKKQIEKQDLAKYKDYKVVSHHLVGGKMEIVVCADNQPDESFSQGYTTLEDVYFAVINA